MNKIRLLSLFDGMGGAAIALKELGFELEKYYASEVDKHAIAQTSFNFPNVEHLGDVRKVDGRKLGHIHLLAGGSPCQSFSFAGKQNGMTTTENVEVLTLEHYLQLKSENFEFQGQSYLFWEYVRILKELREVNPNVLFFLENVEMEKKWERVLSEALGLFGVHINSALVSAQNRKRIYWSNIKTRTSGLFGEIITDFPQPKDRGILLKDILEKEVDEKYFLSKKMIFWLHKHASKRNKGVKFVNDFNKSSCLTVSAQKQNIDTDYVYLKIDKKGNLKDNQNKASCFTAGGNSEGNHSDMDLICVKMVGRKLDENGTRKDNSNIKATQQIEPIETGKSNCLTTVPKDNLILNNSDYRIRRLTPTECAGLQTIPDWYKFQYIDKKGNVKQTSDTQVYRMLGNGWTNNVIKHCFSFIDFIY